MSSQDHRLTYLDQTAFELMRATGRGQLIQCVWVYKHPVDMEALKRFHRNMSDSHASRLIERSPLPFGRPRWVKSLAPQSAIRIEDQPRPRGELMDWADELASLPMDPECGPSWHLVVQPLTDGSTAVSMVGSHVIGDGVGAILQILEAVTGHARDLGYSAQGARPRLHAVASDLRQTVSDLPGAVQSLFKAAKLLYSRRDKLDKGTAPQPNLTGELDQTVTVPAIAVFIEVDDWDRRAKDLGGNSYSLVCGFGAKLGEKMGRTRTSDGAVTLIIAVNLRESLDDTRALALTFASASVDPTKVTTDLSESRAAVREARQKAKNEPDPTLEILGLIPWLPQAGVKSIVELMFGYSADLPVSCSNLGDLPPQLGQVDGTDAEYVFIRAKDANVTHLDLQRSHGQLVVVSGRINGKVSISVEAYEVGAENSKTRLRELAAETLSEFGLTGVIE